MQELAYVGALIYDTTMPNKAEVSELRVNIAITQITNVKHMQVYLLVQYMYSAFSSEPNEE